MAAAVATVPVAKPVGPLVDSFFLALESGSVSWADLIVESALVTSAATALDSMRDEPAAASTVRFGGREVYEFDSESPVDDRIVEWWTNEYKERERLDNWEVPDLTLRSDIAEHFPVVLEALEATADGRERFRVLFDEERLEEWASTRAESNDENMEYADWVQTRLVFALNQYAYKYRVESVGGPGADHVAIFAMAHPSAPRRGRAAIPTLRSFPVTWDRDPADHTRHLIKPHMKRLSEGDAEPHDLILELLEKLLECDDCTVEYMPVGAAPTYIMTVIIPTAAPAAPAAAPLPAPKLTAAPLPAAAPLSAAAPLPAPKPVVMGGAGAARPLFSGPRAIDIMKANRLAWDRDALDTRIHRIKRRAGDCDRIIAELAKCGNCTVVATPKDRQYMCVVTMR